MTVLKLLLKVLLRLLTESLKRVIVRMTVRHIFPAYGEESSLRMLGCVSASMDCKLRFVISNTDHDHSADSDQ